MRTQLREWIIAVVVAWIGGALVAQDTTPPRLEDRLIEVLRENRTITEAQAEDLRRVAVDYRCDEERRFRRETGLDREIDVVADRLAEDAVRSQYFRGKGIRFASTDPDASLEIGLRLQFRFTQSLGEDAPGDDDETQFSVPRARLSLGGHAFDPRLRYRILSDFAGTTVDTAVSFPGLADDFSSDARFADLKDAYVAYAFDPAFMIRGGQFKAPYSRQSLTGAGDLVLVDRAITDKVFPLGRELGVMAHGGVGGAADDVFTYALGVFNGEGDNRSNDDRGLAYAARLTVSPFGEVPYTQGDLRRSESFQATLGLNALLHQNDGQVGLGEDRAIGADVAARYAGVSLLTELHVREDAAVVGDDPSAVGWLAQVGYALVADRLEIALRVATIEWDDNGTGDSARRESLVALSWYLDGHAVKWQADFGRVEDRDGDGSAADEWRFRVQFQLTF